VHAPLTGQHRAYPQASREPDAPHGTEESPGRHGRSREAHDPGDQLSIQHVACQNLAIHTLYDLRLPRERGVEHVIAIDLT